MNRVWLFGCACGWVALEKEKTPSHPHTFTLTLTHPHSPSPSPLKNTRWHRREEVLYEWSKNPILWIAGMFVGRTHIFIYQMYNRSKFTKIRLGEGKNATECDVSVRGQRSTMQGQMAPNAKIYKRSSSCSVSVRSNGHQVRAIRTVEHSASVFYAEENNDWQTRS